MSTLCPICQTSSCWFPLRTAQHIFTRKGIHSSNKVGTHSAMTALRNTVFPRQQWAASVLNWRLPIVFNRGSCLFQRHSRYTPAVTKKPWTYISLFWLWATTLRTLGDATTSSFCQGIAVKNIRRLLKSSSRLSVQKDSLSLWRTWEKSTFFVINEGDKWFARLDRWASYLAA